MRLIIILIIAVIILKVFLRSPKVRGQAGESHVSNDLSRLPSEYKVLNDVIVPSKNGTSQIDHIVVSPYGVFVIETKNYTGWIFGSENSDQWKETFKTTKGNFFRNPIKQNWGHVYALSDFLNYDKSYFKPIVVFSNCASLDVDSTMPVIYMKQLKGTILGYTEPILTEDSVNDIYSRIMEANQVGSEAHDKHVINVRNNLAKHDIAISEGKCPRCGGDLKLRSGKYGQFYGCSNYPRCKFTQKL